MAKIDIKIGDNQYQIDESVLAEAKAAIKANLTTSLAGTGDTIIFDDVEYQVDANKVAALTNDLVQHLDTMSGTGASITINGVDYNLDVAKVDAILDTFETSIVDIINSTLEGSGQEYYTFTPTALSFRSTAPLNELHEIRVDGETVDSSNYTLTEGSTIVTFSIDYLKTLDVGNHEVAIISNNQMAVGGFTVAAPELSEHGFYYNQPYLAYVSVLSDTVIVSFNQDNIVTLATVSSQAIEQVTYTVENGVISFNSALGPVSVRATADPTVITCIELATDFALTNMVVSDNKCFYMYNESLDGYILMLSAQTAQEYEIKTGINGKPTLMINDSAFYGDHMLSRVVIPNSVTTIGSYAFEDCRSLMNVEIPNSVTNIGGSAFYNCASLCSVTIPNSVKTIGVYTFYGCSSLTSITIPEGITSIDRFAFEGCEGLTSVTIPDSVTSIGNNAFSSCTGLTGITIPDSVTTIGDYTFSNCTSLTSITIPDSVTTIGTSAFSGCRGLTSITIFDSVTTIGNYAFASCTGLTGVTIGDSVTSIGGYAFYDCTGLTSITLPFVGATNDGTSNTHFGYIFGASSWTNNNSYVPASLKTVVITGGTSIGASAFNGCNNIESITLPFVGGSATATSASSSTLFGYIFGTWTYTGGTATKQNYDMLNYVTYYIPTSLKSVIITGGNILYGAFQNCSTLTSVTIPDGITRIGDYAFEYCGLTSITIPDSVTYIGYRAFASCSGLTSVHITDIAAWCAISFGVAANPLNSAKNLYLNGTLVTDLVIPDGVTAIRGYTFEGFTSLTSITIPDSVISIGEQAFSGCTGLTSVTIPDNVTSIDRYAFSDCTSLTSVTIGEGVMSIYYAAFRYCRSLENITFNGTTAQWNAITKGTDWNKDVPATYVQCTDGQVAL